MRERKDESMKDPCASFIVREGGPCEKVLSSWSKRNVEFSLKGVSNAR